MSEMQGATRMNISVPRELKAKMDAATVTVNWSAAACRAFEVELLRLESERTVETMDETVDRLLAADELDSNETHQHGIELGASWAKEDGRPRDLRRLEKLDDDREDYIGIWDNGMNDSGIACGLCEWLCSGDEYDNVNLDEFWEGILGKGGRELINDENFARGFVKGALDVWAKAQAAARAKGKRL